LASSRLKNQRSFEHSCRNRRLNFEEGVVGGFAPPGKIQDHLRGLGPLVNSLGDELRAVVQPDARHPIPGQRQVEGGDTS
jgi:hypothetical protein